MDFAYNASALAAGAVIERGHVITRLPSLGSVVLAPTGGEGRTAVSAYFSEELELANAETRVAGRQWQDGNETKFTTWTSVLMRGVSVFGRVHIGEMGTTMTSTRGFEKEDDHAFDIVVWFRNVRVDGRKIDVMLDEPLMRMRRYDELRSHIGSGRNAEALAKRHDAGGDDLTKAVKERKAVRVSLVQGIRGWEEEALATVHVRGLGTFRFGELLLKPGQRRVNLIRATFGKGDARLETIEAHASSIEAPFANGPTGGSMTLGSGEGNGTPIEP